jgi:hypothetical protein
MGFLDRLLGNDHARAAQHPDRESASAKASRKNREGHRRNLTRNARKQQAREDTYWRNL